MGRRLRPDARQRHRRSREAGHDDEAIKRNFYLPRDYAHLADQLVLVDGDHDLLGDGSIQLLLTPGHTPGHQSVRVGARLVLGGDVTHFASGLDDHRFPMFADDHDAQAASARRLKALRDAGANVQPGHDPAVLAAGPVPSRPPPPRRRAIDVPTSERFRAPNPGQAPHMPSPTAPLGPHHVRRVGFGAMQLPGKGVLGPPRDHDEAIAVIRRAREHGVDHIDTASFYGPDVANQLLAEALDPWPTDVRVVSKVGAKRDDEGAWLPALSPSDVRTAVESDLRMLGIDQLTAVSLRIHDEADESDDVFAEALGALVELRDEGKLELIGLSNVGVRHLELAGKQTEIACVQNQYGLLDRGGEDVFEATREHDIAFVPFFPLGSAFGVAPRPAEHPEVQRIATDIGATATQVALAWLLYHGENILLIPGTSSLDHLEENLAADTVTLTPEMVELLDGLATS